MGALAAKYNTKYETGNVAEVICKYVTNPHWARVVGYGPFFICVIHTKGLCPSSGDNIRLLMMMMLSTGLHCKHKSSFSYPYPTKWGRYNMFFIML
jgi:hypothetical protein